MSYNIPEKVVTAIIVNYNCGKFSAECIASLRAQTGVSIDIVVVDNASQDDSLVLLRQRFGDSVRFIANNENVGFGRANNLAVTSVTSGFLLLINPDIVFETPMSLLDMIRYLEDNPTCGVVGPEINEPRKNRKIKPRLSYPSSRHLKHSNWLDSLPGEIAWILGACLLFRTDCYREIGGFDEIFFLYGEDADICLRLRKRGYVVGYCDQAKTSHWSGASELIANQYEIRKRKNAGLYLFCEKHYDRRDVMNIAKSSLFKSRVVLASIAARKFLRMISGARAENEISRMRAELESAASMIEKLETNHSA